jgi:hypothetical protein
MDPTHLGYTTWQAPVRNAMPAVTEIQVPAEPELGVAIDGSPNAWPADGADAPAPVLPELSPAGQSSTYIEVFNRGGGNAAYSVAASAPWLHVAPAQGAVDQDKRLEVSADWSAVPAGPRRAALTVTSPGARPLEIAVPVFKPDPGASGFIESDGYVAVEAPHFDRAVNSQGITWKVLDGYGRTLGAVTPFPVTADSQTAGGGSPRLEYDLYLTSTGDAKVEVTLAPTVNFTPGHGLRFAVSIDEEPPRIEEIVAKVGDDKSAWAESVLNGVRKVASLHKVGVPGRHVLKFWFVDPGVVLERIVVDMGGVRPSYLGPPESAHIGPDSTATH